MAKRLTDKQKQEMTQSFIQGKTVVDLSKDFNFTNSTIIRNLKKTLGEKKYTETLSKNINEEICPKIEKSIFEENLNINIKEEISTKNLTNEITASEDFNADTNTSNSFFEIPPLDCEIDNLRQKDLSSIPLSEVKFPSTVYMVVDKKIELEVKYLKDFPSWQFLSDEELSRKTIEIYLDIKLAKKVCNKDQKVIKVPNTNVFKIVAPLLNSRGITRIVSAEQLIAI